MLSKNGKFSDINVPISVDVIVPGVDSFTFKFENGVRALPFLATLSQYGLPYAIDAVCVPSDVSKPVKHERKG